MLNDPKLLRSWNLWQQSPLGLSVAAQELDCLEKIAPRLYGRFFAQIGDSGCDFPELERVQYRVILDNYIGSGPNATCRAEQLPLATESVNIVYLPHALELSYDSHEVLREADRVLIPDGRLVLTVFNPISLYGLRSLFTFGGKKMPWKAKFLTYRRVHDWLKLLGFEVEDYCHIAFRPPIQHPLFYQRMSVLEKLGEKYWPGGSGVFVIVAIKRMVPLNLITPSWKKSRQFLPSGAIEPTTRNHSNV